MHKHDGLAVAVTGAAASGFGGRRQQLVRSVHDVRMGLDLGKESPWAVDRLMNGPDQVMG